MNLKEKKYPLDHRYYQLIEIAVQKKLPYELIKDTIMQYTDIQLRLHSRRPSIWELFTLKHLLTKLEREVFNYHE